jgi:hypothetical protein
MVPMCTLMRVYESAGLAKSVVQLMNNTGKVYSFFNQLIYRELKVTSIPSVGMTQRQRRNSFSRGFAMHEGDRSLSQGFRDSLPGAVHHEIDPRH